MRKRVDRQLLPPSAGTTTQTQAQMQTPALPKLADEMEQVNALYSLIENRYSRTVWSSSQDYHTDIHIYMYLYTKEG